MWRFVMGFFAGSVFFLIVAISIPSLKFENDPEKKLIEKTKHEITIIIGCDESIVTSEVHEDEFKGKHRVIRIFQKQEDAEACKNKLMLLVNAPN